MSHSSDQPQQSTSGILYETTIDFAIEDVWILLRDFGHWDKWIPSIKNLEILNDKTGVGLIKRYVIAATQNTYTSELTELDDTQHSLRYLINSIEPPLPGFISSMNGVDCEKVSAMQTKITWYLWATFDEAKADEESKNERIKLVKVAVKFYTECLVKYVNEHQV